MPFFEIAARAAWRGGRLEDGDGRALLRAVAHARPRAGARAGRQSQRIQKNRFAGARFAGQHVQAIREIERDILDENQVADLERREHRQSSRAGS